MLFVPQVFLHVCTRITRQFGPSTFHLYLHRQPSTTICAFFTHTHTYINIAACCQSFSALTPSIFLSREEVLSYCYYSLKTPKNHRKTEILQIFLRCKCCNLLIYGVFVLQLKSESITTLRFLGWLLEIG